MNSSDVAAGAGLKPCATRSFFTPRVGAITHLAQSLAQMLDRRQAASDLQEAGDHQRQRNKERDLLVGSAKAGKHLQHQHEKQVPAMFGSALGMLQGIMLLLLLAVCGNTANLVLARASARQREIGVRLALGAGPWRVISLLLAENISCWRSGRGARRRDRGLGDRGDARGPDHRRVPDQVPDEPRCVGLAFAMLLGVVCGLMFGWPRRCSSSRVDPQTALRVGSRDRGAQRPCGTR